MDVPPYPLPTTGPRPRLSCGDVRARGGLDPGCSSAWTMIATRGAEMWEYAELEIIVETNSRKGSSKIGEA